MEKIIDFKDMIVPTVEILYASKKEMNIHEINKKLFNYLKVSKNEKAVMHENSSISELEYRSGWARTYLKKYALINNPRVGVWIINDVYQGEKITKEQVIAAVKKNIVYVEPVIENVDEVNVVFNSNESNKKIIMELKEKYHNEKISLFLGAGVSMSANLLSWDDLISQLSVYRFKDENTFHEIDGELSELVQLEKANRECSSIMQTRSIKQNVEPKRYIELLQKSLYHDAHKINIDNALFDGIVGLIRNKNKILIKNIITFNFDDLIEKRLQKESISYFEYTDLNSKQSVSEVSICHVHGLLASESEPDEINIDDIIFSEEQYHKVYNDPYHWSNIKQVVSLKENTCLFIGCSLTDPNMRRILDIARNKGNLKHFAIMKFDKITIPNKSKISEQLLLKYKEFHLKNRNDYFKSLGVHVLWVNDFDEIPKILEEISN